MNPTDEQRARMRAALIGIGIDEESISGKNREGQRVLAGLVRSWVSAYGTYDQVCYMLEQAAIRGIRGYEQFRVYARRYSRKLIEQMHTVENFEKYRADNEEDAQKKRDEIFKRTGDQWPPEIREIHIRLRSGVEGPQDGQASSGVEPRIMDRSLPNAGEVLPGPEQGGQGKVVGTDGNSGFIPAKRRRK